MGKNSSKPLNGSMLRVGRQPRINVSLTDRRKSSFSSLLVPCGLTRVRSWQPGQETASPTVA